MKTRCPDCDNVQVIGGLGNGRCSRCHGSGKQGTIADDIGGGKGSCERCHGNGQCITCAGDGFVMASEPARPHATAELNPLDKKVAIKTFCPKCGEIDWFEWKFLGHLKDPVCGHTWYVGSGAYTTQQMRAVFQAGGMMAKYMTSGVSGEGAMVGKVVGGFCGVVFGIAFRLPFAAVMIPLQAVVRLSQSKANSAPISRASGEWRS